MNWCGVYVWETEEAEKEPQPRSKRPSGRVRVDVRLGDGLYKTNPTSEYNSGFFQSAT